MSQQICFKPGKLLEVNLISRATYQQHIIGGWPSPHCRHILQVSHVIVLPIVGSGHVTTPPIVLRPMASPVQTRPTNESGGVGPENPRVASRCRHCSSCAPTFLPGCQCSF